MTVVPSSEVSAVRIDKDQDIIPITVGLYRLFMAGGVAGREAMDLYIHLIFTARLQETQQVRANNVYLSRGLSWGIAKVKAAKAWLSGAGLIHYVRPRAVSGQLGEVYIRLQFLPRAETLAIRLGGVPDPLPVEPAAPEEYQDDLTPSLFEEIPITTQNLEGEAALQAAEEEPVSEGASGSSPDMGSEDDPQGSESPVDAITTGSDSDPVVTTGSIYHPVADHAHGAEQQMLEVKNEMLEVRKGKGEEKPSPDPRKLIKIEPDKAAPPPEHHRIADEWYRRYASASCIMISPRVEDYKAASELHAALRGNLSDLSEALDMYFGRYRELWFAVTRTTAKHPDDQKRPDWTFKIFCARYPEIVAAAKAGTAEGAAPSGAGKTKFGHLFRKLDEAGKGASA